MLRLTRLKVKSKFLKNEKENLLSRKKYLCTYFPIVKQAFGIDFGRGPKTVSSLLSSFTLY